MEMEVALMAAREIEVSPAQLNAGAQSCQHAAASAQRAAQELDRVALPAGIFGDFGEAHAFHAAVESGHQHHRDRLQSHHAALTDVSEKAGIAAQDFTDSDEGGADRIAVAGDQID